MFLLDIVSRQKPVAWAEVLRLWLLPWLLPPCQASSSHTTSASPSSFLSFFSSAASPSNISPLLESRLLFLAKRHCFGGGSCSMPNTFKMGNFVNEAKCSLIDNWSDHGDLWKEKWKQCSSKLACCAQLLPHILPHFPECIAQSIFTYLNLAQLIWRWWLCFQKCPVLPPSKNPFFWAGVSISPYLHISTKLPILVDFIKKLGQFYKKLRCDKFGNWSISTKGLLPSRNDEFHENADFL